MKKIITDLVKSEKVLDNQTQSQGGPNLAVIQRDNYLNIEITAQSLRESLMRSIHSAAL